MPSEMKRYVIGAGEDHTGDVSVVKRMKSPFSRVRRKQAKPKTNVEAGEAGIESKDTGEGICSTKASPQIAPGLPELDHPMETKGQVSDKHPNDIIQSVPSSRQSDVRSEASESRDSDMESLYNEMNNKLRTLEERVIMRLDTLREQLDSHVQVVEEHRQQVQEHQQRIRHLHEKFVEPPKTPQLEPPCSNNPKPEWSSDIFNQLRDAQQWLARIDKEMLLLRHNMAEFQTSQKLTPAVMERVARNVACTAQIVGRTLSRDEPERTHSLHGTERVHFSERADCAHSQHRPLRSRSRDRADRVRSCDWPERDELSPVSEHHPMEDPGVLPIRQFSARICGDDWSPTPLPSNNFPESTPKVFVGKLDLNNMASPRSSNSDSSFVRLWQTEMAPQSERRSNTPTSGGFRHSTVTSLR